MSDERPDDLPPPDADSPADLPPPSGDSSPDLPPPSTESRADLPLPDPGSAAHMPPPGQGQPGGAPTTGATAGEFTYGKLALVAAMPVVAGVLIGLIAGVLMAFATDEIAGVADTLRGVLTITAIGLGGSVRVVGDFDGSGSFTMLPLLVPLIGAWLVFRFAARPLRNPVVMGVGVVMTALMWLFASAMLSIPTLDIGFGDSLTSSPAAASVLGGSLACWGGAYLLSRFATPRRFLLLLAAWSGLGWLAATVTMVIRSETMGFAEMLATSYVMATVSVNGVLVALYWVLLGKIGITVDGSARFLDELIRELGGEQMSVGFFEAAGEHGWLWLVALVVIGGLIALAWITPQPTSRQEMVRRSGAMAAGIFALLWLGHLTGAPRFAGDFFDVGLASATVGMITVPWGLVVPAVLATAIWAATLWVIAYQRGAGWATMPDLNNPQATSAAATAAGQTLSRAWSRLSAALRDLANTQPPGTGEQSGPGPSWPPPPAPDSSAQPSQGKQEGAHPRSDLPRGPDGPGADDGGRDA